MVPLAVVGLVGLAGGLWLRFRNSHRTSADWHLSPAAAEQSPQPTILLEGTTLEVIRSNAAFLHVSGYSADELKGMPAAQLFVEDTSGDPLMNRLRDPARRVALKVRQRCKGGDLIDVDLIGHRVQL